MIVNAAIQKDGKTYIGKRHNLILNETLPFGYLKGGIQGFVTVTGRFVDRKEAAKIAYDCGQIDIQKKELFSEDLW